MTDEQPVSFDKSAQSPSATGHSPYDQPPRGADHGPGPTHPPAGYPPTGYPPTGYPPSGYGGPPPGYGYPLPGYGNPGYGYAPYGPAGPPHEKPSTNIGWAIAAIFTFWPLAIPAFIYSSKVDSYWFAGNRAGAQQASKDARLWGLIGVIIGAVFFVLAVVWFVIVVSVFTNAVHNLPADPTAFPS